MSNSETRINGANDHQFVILLTQDLLRVIIKSNRWLSDASTKSAKSLERETSPSSKNAVKSKQKCSLMLIMNVYSCYRFTLALYYVH